MEGLFDDDDETEEDGGLFQSTTLDVEAALGSTKPLLNPHYEVEMTTP